MNEKSDFMEDKADEQQKDNYRSHYRNNRGNTLERCFYKCLRVYLKTGNMTNGEGFSA